MGELGLDCADRLDNGLLDVSLNPRNVVAKLSEITPNEGERALVSYAVIVLTLILNELATVLVYCIVC